MRMSLNTPQGSHALPESHVNTIPNGLHEKIDEQTYAGNILK